MLYDIACELMAGVRASLKTRHWMRERWDLVHSRWADKWGNAERELWVYVDAMDDWIPESDTVACAYCESVEATEQCFQVLSWGSRSTLRSPNTLYYCEGCRDSHTSTCYSCEHSIADSDVENINDEYYCPPCASDENERLEEEEGNGSVREYHSTSRPNAWSVRGVEAWSVEIEMELPDWRARDSFVAYASALPYKGAHKPIFERDGSLDRERGVECIFSLYTSREDLIYDIGLLQAEAKRWKAIAWDLPKHGGREAGIHISTNRNENGWSMKALMRLGFILTVCREELSQFAGRTSHFAPFPERKNIEDVRWKPLANFANGHLGKYCAINVRDSRLEWRMFRSTLSTERMRRNLNLVCELEALAKSDAPPRNLAQFARLIIATIK